MKSTTMNPFMLASFIALLVIAIVSVPSFHITTQFAQAANISNEQNAITLGVPVATSSLDTYRVFSDPEFTNADPEIILGAELGAVQKRFDPTVMHPAHLAIPSIALDSSIIGVGINRKGEMDVPDGTTDTIGWYRAGTVPGAIGSAVLDAHVFAAFSDLNKLKVGDDIYVTSNGGKKMRFVVRSTHIYALGELSPNLLFNRRDARRLNLITCAGSYIPSLGTYDHRLVVFAVLAG